MIYEAVLLFGIAFTVGYALLASMQWSYPLPPARRTALQLALFVALGAYFVVCWSRGGQTLALKAWRLKVIESSGRSLTRGRALVRYLLAWHLWLPGLAIAAVFELGVPATLITLTLSFALFVASAFKDSQLRFLHDRWTGTRVIRVAQ